MYLLFINHLKCFHHVETSQLIFDGNQFTGFYTIGILAANGNAGLLLRPFGCIKARDKVVNLQQNSLTQIRVVLPP